MASQPTTPQPAHLTKHIPLLRYPFRNAVFHLAQLDDGATNGTALWLGAQCLSLYLADVLKNKAAIDPRRPRAIELGTGIGLSALALSSIGWDVLATDLPGVISAVLSANISRNASQLPPNSGRIQVRALDWTISPERWVWNNANFVASSLPPHESQTDEQVTLGPPFDLIISSDTLYSPDIVQPLLRTLHALSTLSGAHSPYSRIPPVYLCIERRDPTLIDRAFSDARTMWNFAVERIPHKKVAKAMGKGGTKWNKEDWEGVEIWKLTLASGEETGVA